LVNSLKNPPDYRATLQRTTTHRTVLIAAPGCNAHGKAIADWLSITEETVKSHVTNILSKLGANDRTHAVTIGLKREIIEL
jgi:DNA-binding NarL/FixJ family response regulator